MSEIEVDKITQKGTSGISITDDLKMSSGKSIQVDSIKHTDGTTAITINSDGSLSGKFEGAVKFKQIGKPSSGSPASGKVWIALAIETTSWWDAGDDGMGFGYGFGQPCAIKIGAAAWEYLDVQYGFDNNEALSSTTGLISASNLGSRRAIGYTYTIEMDATT
jgi:hypothetical protein